MNFISDFYSVSFQELDLYHIVSVFFIYSILGWLVESIYMSICEKKIVNRGFIKGPICPIYGGCATVIYFLLYPLRNNLILIYFVGVIVATALEFLVAQAMLYIFGEVWWDYNEKPFNYKGVICLESSIAWGFYCVMLFGFLEKMSVKFVDFYTARIGQTAGEAIVSFLIIYYIVSFIKTVRARNVEKNLSSELEEDIDSMFVGGDEVAGGRISRMIQSFRK